MKKTLMTLGLALGSLSLAYAGCGPCSSNSSNTSNQNSKQALVTVKSSACADSANQCCAVKCKASKAGSKSTKKQRAEARRAARDAIRQSNTDTITYSSRGGSDRLGTVSVNP